MNKTIDEIAKEERRKYQKKWREKNKDKVRKHQEDYWKRKAAQLLVEQERAESKAGQ